MYRYSIASSVSRVQTVFKYTVSAKPPRCSQATDSLPRLRRDKSRDIGYNLQGLLQVCGEHGIDGCVNIRVLPEFSGESMSLYDPFDIAW